MRTPDKLSFTEYKLEYRHDCRPGSGRVGKTKWQDGSGYNNQTGTYYHASQVRAQKSRLQRNLGRHYTNVEFRVLSREVTRTEWAEAEIDASS